MGVTDLLRSFVELWDGVILWYFTGLNSFYAFLLLASAVETWRHWALTQRTQLTERLPDDAFPPVSVLIPAHNEETVIVETVRAQLELDYPSLEVVVVNDGSTDETFARLREAFDLHEVPPAFPRRLETAQVRGYFRSRTSSRLMVIDKEQGGKADALNAGLTVARYPYCVTIDADTVAARSAIRRLARVFFITDADLVAGIGGTLRVANGCRFDRGRPTSIRVPDHPLAAVQVPEYLRAFLFGRLGWNRLGGNLLTSGAFSLYRKDLLAEAGGFPLDSVTEDLELTVRIHGRLRERGTSYALPFVPDPVAWTQVPEDRNSLGNQRERWHRGLISTMFQHLHLVGNPRYGSLGLLAAPYFFFGEMLAPVMEVSGYVTIALAATLGMLDLSFALLFLALAYGYMALLAAWAVWMELLTFRVYPRLRDYLKLMGWALVEPFGYRPLTLWWRLKAFWKFLRERSGWGEMRRRPLPSGRRPGPGRGRSF